MTTLSREVTQKLLCESFGFFGKLHFPYQKMGNVDSLDLFGPNELVIFAFYYHNRTRYRRALDIGANLGLHTILMRRLGWEVWSYEPDPFHYWKARERVDANCKSVNGQVLNFAVSDVAGPVEFVRVLGNTTGSHIAGCKIPYGDTEKFVVQCVKAEPIFREVDFAKIDAEGNEAKIICSVPHETFPDAIVEVGSPDNALKIFDHLFKKKRMWSQKIGWKEVLRLEDMPIHHKEGSLFIGNEEPWRS